MRWTRFLRRARWDRERAQELEAYVEAETDRNIALGMPPMEARDAARRKLGNPALVREEIYRMNTLVFLETLWQDLRYSLRQLRRSPAFTAVAILSLALGIGANTAIFTLLDQVILRSLPVTNPHELVMLRFIGRTYGVTMGPQVLSYPMYKDLRDRNQVFTGMMCKNGVALAVGYGSETERVPGELVSGNYFEVLGVGAAIGRTITPQDDVLPGGHPIAMLSYDYWMNRFRGDPNILGRAIIVNGHSLTIIGVSQKGFDGVELGSSPKIRIPIAMKAQMTHGWFSEFVTLTNRRAYWVNAYARLKPGISIDQARASLQPLFHSIIDLEARAPDFANAGAQNRRRFLESSLGVQSGMQGQSSLRLDYDLPLRVLMGIVGLVLLIACANVANLMLARAAGRQREIAVRLALGAARSRLIRYSIVEGLLLSLAGAGIGLLLAMWMAQKLVLFIPTELPVNLTTTPDLRILTFTLTVSVLTGLLFSVAPALAASGVELLRALQWQGRSIAGGAQARFRQVLVIAQVAFSAVLLIGAGLFLRTLINLRSVDPGLRTENVILFSANPRLNGYDNQRSRQFFRDLLEKLPNVAGVQSMGIGVVRVLDNDSWGDGIRPEGANATKGSALFNIVSPGYLPTLGMQLLSGRNFQASDGARKQKVVLVNETFVRTFFEGRNPIGRYFGVGNNPRVPADVEIVGVIRDARYMRVREEMSPQVFYSFDQHDDFQQATIYLKTRQDPLQMFDAVRQAVREIDPNVPLFATRTLTEQRDRTLHIERLMASLASAFGLLATVLAVIGLYGLIAYTVAGRTREIGVRMALGAQGSRVGWMVIKDVLVLIAIGAAIALPAAWWLGRFVRTQLYHIEPVDPLNTAAAMLALLLAAFIAGAVPAMRAARVDPIHALREE
jgi:predicted permease